MYKHFIKRLLDILVGLLALPFVALFILVFAPLIYLEDRGPVFYRAERLGLGGRMFRMLKFRSMRVGAPQRVSADGLTVLCTDDDPRVTRIGRFMRMTSIDEVPQFLNVLMGQMSLVGNRPDTPHMLSVYTPEESRWLFRSKPGITGYNQAYYRNAADGREKLDHDVYYARHESFCLDLRILLKSVQTVVLRKNINAR